MSGANSFYIWRWSWTPIPGAWWAGRIAGDFFGGGSTTQGDHGTQVRDRLGASFRSGHAVHLAGEYQPAGAVPYRAGHESRRPPTTMLCAGSSSKPSSKRKSIVASNRDRADLELHMAESLKQYYNRRHLHSALGYRSPASFEQSLQVPTHRLSFFRHEEIYRPGAVSNREEPRAPPGPIDGESFHPSIPWRVALQQSSPPLPHLSSCLQPTTPFAELISTNGDPGFPYCLNRRGHSITMPRQGVLSTYPVSEIPVPEIRAYTIVSTIKFCAYCM